VVGYTGINLMPVGFRLWKTRIVQLMKRIGKSFFLIIYTNQKMKITRKEINKKAPPFGGALLEILLEKIRGRRYP
jgi:hypothetical protein